MHTKNPNFTGMDTQSLLHPFADDITDYYGLRTTMLRLDLLHPVVSGNKIFKLKNYLAEALSNKKTSLLTFGGAHSNHLVATAYAAKAHGLKAIGMVRGEKPHTLSPALRDCIAYGMELRYLSRLAYSQLDMLQLSLRHPEATVIPAGGYGLSGATGAATILDAADTSGFDFILAASGTGTMGAGLTAAAPAHQKVILVSVLKNNISLSAEIKTLLEMMQSPNTCEISYDYHMGGYAKKSSELFSFMNGFYQTHGIPTDFVYTGKLVFAFYEMAKAARFPSGAKVLLIHSGGLQGNRSLTNRELSY